MADLTKETCILDVGCGADPKGTVNVDFFRRGVNPHVGQSMKEPHTITNFIVADACHLPFKNETFSLVFSSHVIEHVYDPSEMLVELCRVSKGKITVRCPHKRGSGAKRPHHLNYIDEAWFKQKAESLGLNHVERITVYDYPVSNRLPYRIISKANRRIAWKIFRHAEFLINKKLKIPYEVECQITK
jgi:ubiquinone/menaquinone biosynthesis C-methylase UbiE